METIYLKMPLGITKGVGDKNGLAHALFGFKETISTEISECLQNAVIQLTDFFKGKRINFDLKLHFNSTRFQQNFGKSY